MGGDRAPDQQRSLIAALRDPVLHGLDCARVDVIETHISWVLLTGVYAYKIKKAVVLPFVDCAALESRRRYCEEELRLNRRLAPALYLDVVAIGGTADAPVLYGSGPAIEYAVRMLQFPQTALLSHLLKHGELAGADIDAIAIMVAGFHRQVAVAAEDSPWGQPAELLRYAEDNFSAIGQGLGEATESSALLALRVWMHQEFACREAVFARRRRDGFIRECHGDLHLNNIARIGEAITVFDCIEYSEHLRWIDVASEIAFTAMDLDDRGRPDFSARLLNAYLEATGDYASLATLRYYLVYRALVRAKVIFLRAGQIGAEAERTAVVREYQGYLALAQRYARPPHPALIVTHGLSGSGKTSFTQQLLERLGAVRIRTDVERRRLRVAIGNGLIGADPYGLAATRATYSCACDRVREIVAGGYTAIVDATCLAAWQRHVFRDLARELSIPFAILSFSAPLAVLGDRVAARAAAGSDASEADLEVLAAQLRTQEPLTRDEMDEAVSVDATAGPPCATDPDFLRSLARRLDGIPAITAGDR